MGCSVSSTIHGDTVYTQQCIHSTYHYTPLTSCIPPYPYQQILGYYYMEILRYCQHARHNVPANLQRLAKHRSGSTITLARWTALHCMQCIHCYTCGMHRTASYPPRGTSSSLLPRSTLLLRCSLCSRISPALRAAASAGKLLLSYT